MMKMKQMLLIKQMMKKWACLSLLLLFVFTFFASCAASLTDYGYRGGYLDTPNPTTNVSSMYSEYHGLGLYGGKVDPKKH